MNEFEASVSPKINTYKNECVNIYEKVIFTFSDENDCADVELQPNE